MEPFEDEERPTPDQGGEGNQGEGPAEGDDVEEVEAGETDGSGDRQTEVERAAEREERAKEG
jgi:hypothetical protein